MAWAASRSISTPLKKLLHALAALSNCAGQPPQLTGVGRSTLAATVSLAHSSAFLENDTTGSLGSRSFSSAVTQHSCGCSPTHSAAQVCTEATPFVPGGCRHGSIGTRVLLPSQFSPARSFATRGGEQDQGRPRPDNVANTPLTPEQLAQHAPGEVDPMDKMLEEWEQLMDQGDTAGVLQLLEKEFEGQEQLPSVPEMLAQEEAEAQEAKAARRDRELALQQDFARSRVRLVDDLGRAYATGKRKCSVARVWVMEGQGRVKINGRPLDAYFGLLQRRADVLAPFQATSTLGQFDVMATVKGGGTTGQAQAVRHGVARALQLFDPELRPILKTEGLLTRDSRVVERKKPGKAKARKSFQWVKR